MATKDKGRKSKKKGKAGKRRVVVRRFVLRIKHAQAASAVNAWNAFVVDTELVCDALPASSIGSIWVAANAKINTLEQTAAEREAHLVGRVRLAT